MLKTKIHDAFRTAHGRGMFQVHAENSNDQSSPCVSSVCRVSRVDVLPHLLRCNYVSLSLTSSFPLLSKDVLSCVDAPSP